MEVEAIGERRLDRRMADNRGRHLDVVVLRDGAGRGHVLRVDGEERRQGRVVLGPEVDRRPIGPQEILGHLPERRRPEGPHRERHALQPADDQQRSVLDIVVRVMVGDEDRAKRAEVDARASELVGHPQSAIEHVGCAVAQHDMGRHAPCPTGSGARARAEKHQLGSRRAGEGRSDLAERVFAALSLRKPWRGGDEGRRRSRARDQAPARSLRPGADRI